MRLYGNRATNFAGEIVSIPERGKITNDPALSVWKREGLSLPKDIISFREQIVGDHVAMVVLWVPEVKPKVEGEL